MKDKSDGFIGLEATRLRLFPDAESGPSKRAWSDWKARGYFSVVKIGGLFCDPSVVRAELMKRFTIPAETK